MGPTARAQFVYNRRRRRSGGRHAVEEASDEEEQRQDSSSSSEDEEDEAEASGEEVADDDDEEAAVEPAAEEDPAAAAAGEKRGGRKGRITISLKKVCKVCKRTGHEAGFKGAVYIDCPMKPCFLCKMPGSHIYVCVIISLCFWSTRVTNFG